MDFFCELQISPLLSLSDSPFQWLAKVIETSSPEASGLDGACPVKKKAG